MALSTTALNESWVGGVDLFDKCYHSLGLRIVRVQVVVIDIAPEKSISHVVQMSEQRLTLQQGQWLWPG